MEEDVQELLNILFNLKDDKHSWDLLSGINKVPIERAIRRWVNDKMKDYNITKYQEVPELKAKVYAYEKIIANSNFKAVLQRKKEKENE